MPIYILRIVYRREICMQIHSIGSANQSVLTQDSKSKLATEAVPSKRETQEKQSNVLKNEEMEASKEDIRLLTDNANQYLDSIKKNLHFEFHESSERMYVAIIDRETQEVIKELPPREFLDVVGKIKEVIGLLIDEKV